MVYGWDSEMVAAVEGFGKFPALRSLDIGEQSGCTESGLLADEVMRHLSHVTQLTKLVMVSPELEEVTPGELADVIGGMTQLQVLVLRHVRLCDPQQQQQQPPEDPAAGQAPAAAAATAADGGTDVLSAVISALPQLLRLVLWDSSVKESQLSGFGAAAAAATARDWHEHQHWFDEW
jgi:hypothetical protein